MLTTSCSNGNTIGVDANTEKYELLNGSLEGVVDVQDRKQLRISALTGIDEQILFTKTPSGQGADKTTVPESWKQLIGRKQKDEARPAIEKVVNFLTTDKTWTIKFNPLSVPTEKEQAETANQWSQADERYSQLGWVSNDEGIATLKKRGGYVYPEMSNG
ncbi:anti-CBASS protein Acb1 family protein [Enterobacter hormaechei]